MKIKLILLLTIYFQISFAQSYFTNKYVTAESNCWNTKVGNIITDSNKDVLVTTSSLYHRSGNFLTNNAILVLKLDQNGDTLFSKSLFRNDNLKYYGISISKSNINEYLLTYSHNIGDSTFGVIKLANNGSVIFSKEFYVLNTYGFPNGMVNRFSGFNGICLSDNNYLGCGANSIGNNKPCLVKLDQNGNKVFGLTFFYQNGATNAVFNKVLECKNGDYLCLGYGKVGAFFGIIIVKLNKYGQIKWQKSYKSVIDIFPTAALEDKYGNILLTGYKFDANTQGLIIKTDSLGNVLKSVFSVNSEMNIPWAIKSDNQQNYYINGTRLYNDSNSVVISDHFVLKLDSNLNKIKTLKVDKDWDGVDLTIENNMLYTFGRDKNGKILIANSNLDLNFCEKKEIEYTFANATFSTSNLNFTTVNDILVKNISFMETNSIPYETLCKSTVNIQKSNKENDDINIYPIPTEDELNITSTVEINKVSLTDICGLEVKFEIALKQNQLKLNLGSLKKGIYLIHIYTKDGIIMKKVIKS